MKNSRKLDDESDDEQCNSSINNYNQNRINNPSPSPYQQYPAQSGYYNQTGGTPMYDYGYNNVYSEHMQSYYGQNYYNTLMKNEFDDEYYCEKKSQGKKKVTIEYIENRNKRSVTFSKRKKGLMKKAYELSILAGAEILLLVANKSGHVYTFATVNFKPIIIQYEHLIQKCLNCNPPPSYGYDYHSEDDKGESNEGGAN